MYYILFYKFIDDYLEKKTTFWEPHFAYVEEAYKRGDLIMAGVLAEPTDYALLVFKGYSPKPAEDFAEKDPFVLNGIVKEWKVRPWTVAIGG